VFNPAKTRVIETLLALTADRFEHQVYSINRHFHLREISREVSRGHLPKPELRRERDGFTAVAYPAPPAGVMHRAMLKRLTDTISDDLSRSASRPALVVGHKLTIEGIVAARLASRLGLPYALSIQGNTDAKILAARPDLRPLFARIFHGATMVFPFAPWALRAVEARLGARTGPTRLLPCPTDADSILPPQISAPTVVSAFHLRNYRLKNASRLIAAAKTVGAEFPGFALEIIGDGAPKDVAAIQGLAQGTPVTLAGGVGHAAIQVRYNRAAGFALPSLRESFGLVFVEALLAGCPIVYPRGAAIDGYFDDQPFAIPVDARDVGAIGDGMLRLVRDQAALKASLAQWQASGGPARFRREAIARQFGDGLAAAAAADVNASTIR